MSLLLLQVNHWASNSKSGVRLLCCGFESDSQRPANIGNTQMATTGGAVLSAGMSFHPTGSLPVFVLPGCLCALKCERKRRQTNSAGSSSSKQVDPPLPVRALMCITLWMLADPSKHGRIMRQGNRPPVCLLHRSMTPGLTETQNHICSRSSFWGQVVFNRLHVCLCSRFQFLFGLYVSLWSFCVCL